MSVPDLCRITEKRRSPHEHFVRHDAERILVRSLAGEAGADRVRALVARRERRQCFDRRASCRKRRHEAEVGQQCVAGGGDHDGGRPNAAVYHAGRVCRGKGGRHLNQNGTRDGRGEHRLEPEHGIEGRGRHGIGDEEDQRVDDFHGSGRDDVCAPQAECAGHLPRESLGRHIGRKKLGTKYAELDPIAVPDVARCVRGRERLVARGAKDLELPDHRTACALKQRVAGGVWMVLETGSCAHRRTLTITGFPSSIVTRNELGSRLLILLHSVSHGGSPGTCSAAVATVFTKGGDFRQRPV